MKVLELNIESRIDELFDIYDTSVPGLAFY